MYSFLDQNPVFTMFGVIQSYMSFPGWLSSSPAWCTSYAPATVAKAHFRLSPVLVIKKVQDGTLHIMLFVSMIISCGFSQCHVYHPHHHKLIGAINLPFPVIFVIYFTVVLPTWNIPYPMMGRMISLVLLVTSKHLRLKFTLTLVFFMVKNHNHGISMVNDGEY